MKESLMYPDEIVSRRVLRTGSPQKMKETELKKIAISSTFLPSHNNAGVYHI